MQLDEAIAGLLCHSTRRRALAVFQPTQAALSPRCRGATERQSDVFLFMPMPATIAFNVRRGWSGYITFQRNGADHYDRGLKSHPGVGARTGGS